MTLTAPSSIFNKVLLFFKDPEYYQQLVHIALPMALQQIIMSSLNMVGVMMIGQLGEASVAAVGLANQIFFLLTLVLFGITSGSAMFTAQLWGKQDLPNIHRVLGFALTLSGAAALVFIGIAELIPEIALGFYTTDPEVIALGSEYLRIFGWAYAFIAVSFSYAAILRSTGQVRIPLIVTMTALSFNTVASYALIFGKLGLPMLEVRGAAIAGLAARLLECLFLLALTYRTRSAAAASLETMFRYNRQFIGRILRPVLPVAVNELLWSLGITTYNAIYARIGTDAIAAINIAGAVDNLAFVFFSSIGSACAVLVGNQIGAGQEDRAQLYAGRSLVFGMLGGLLMGGIVLIVRPFILPVYKVSPLVTEYAWQLLGMMAATMWLRLANLVQFIGILRAGGDTRFALLLDGVIIWVIGVPSAAIGAFVFHLPVYWVYLCVMSEETTKAGLALWRFFSRKWIHNLAETV